MHGYGKLISALITNLSKLSSFSSEGIYVGVKLKKAALGNCRGRYGVIEATASAYLAIASCQLLLPSVLCTCQCQDMTFAESSFGSITWSKSSEWVCLGLEPGKGARQSDLTPTRWWHRWQRRAPLW